MHEDLTVLKKAGAGAQGTIYLVTRKTDRIKQNYVLKVFQLKNIQACRREYAALKAIEDSLPSRGLFPRFYSSREDAESAELLIEEMGLDVRQLQKIKPVQHYGAATHFKMIIQLLDCIETFHRLGFVHCDIKFQNVLTSHNPKQDQVYLIDFGLSYKY